MKSSLTLLVTLALAAVPLLALSVNAQDSQPGALARGYRTGYSDGYQAGFGDVAGGGARDFRSKPEYQRADRAYASAYGSLDDYRDGYQQGFEAGYNAGYDRRGFDSTVPPDLKRRAQADTAGVNQPTDANPPNAGNASNSGTQPSNVLLIPRDTIMRVELMSNLSTDVSKRGDSFQARVIEPKDYEGAIVDGRVTQVKRAGKVKGTSQLQLAFEQVRLADGRSAGISAQVIEVIPMSASKGVGKVDPEGGVHGKDSTKSDVEKVGVAAGIGAVIGAIAGGGAGAAIGATIGGGIGTASVLTERGQDIHLWQGQQLRIRTAGDATPR